MDKVQKHNSFNVAVSSLSGHCSAVTALSIKWRLNSKERSVVFGFICQNL
jgi:hypothetical protein